MKMETIGSSLWLLIAWLLFAGLAHAAPPQLDERGSAGYAEFQQASLHRAFAIAPGAAWSWRGEMETPEMAMQAALDDCQRHAQRSCMAYALDGKVIFKPQAWAQAWRPYLTTAQAKQASVGLKPGQRFPDLVWSDAGGKSRTLSLQRGRIVLLHFWGSWCPPCQREMPALQKLHARFKKAPEMQFVFLPVREAAATSRAWLRTRGISVPVADAGVKAEKEGVFQIADGKTIRDRDVARAFPTTYILDRNGIVLFGHIGPVSDWLSLEPLLRDATHAKVD